MTQSTNTVSDDTRQLNRAALYGRGSSTNVQKVLWVVYELGIDFSHLPLGGEYGGNDEAWFRKMNPNGTVPVWRDGSFCLYESHAIMRFLARKHRGFYGANEAEMSYVDLWLDWFAGVFWQPIRRLFLDVWLHKKITLEDHKAQEFLTQTSRNLTILTKHLEHRKFVAGPELTIADMAIVIGVNRLLGLDYGVVVPAQFLDWVNTIRVRPGFLFACENEPNLPGHSKPLKPML